MLTRLLTLLIATLSVNATAVSQVSKIYELPHNNSMKIHMKNDSIHLTISDEKLFETVYYAGSFSNESNLLSKELFLVKVQNKITRSDLVNIGDSIVFIAIPDWNYRHYIFKFRLSGTRFIPDAAPEALFMQQYTVINTPLIMVNLDYDYIVNVRPENYEFFYKNQSRDYVLATFFNLSRPVDQVENTIRMERNSVKGSLSFGDLDQKEFVKKIASIVKKSGMPW